MTEFQLSSSIHATVSFILAYIAGTLAFSLILLSDTDEMKWTEPVVRLLCYVRLPGSIIS